MALVNESRPEVAQGRMTRIWNLYKSCLDDSAEWTILKSNIRSMCLVAGSPKAHEEPLDNITDLRNHLVPQLDLFARIDRLKDQLERRLLESIPGRTTANGKSKPDKDRWVDFWKSAIDRTKFEEQKEKNSSPGQLQPSGGEALNAEIATTARGVEGPQGDREAGWPAANADLGFSSRLGPLIQQHGSAFEPTATNSDPFQDEDPVQVSDDTKTSQSSEQGNSDSTRIRDNSPLVAVLERFPRDDQVKKAGETIYSLLGENIHQYHDLAYTVVETQWDSLPYALLSAMKPIPLMKGGDIDWVAERNCFV
ncbi:hypothetical protein MMC11_006357 [Xylographa trunciseda]|nr:hypothetical protein [Xylographa trunciseda]